MAEMKIDIRSDVHTAPEDLRGVNQALDVMEDKAEAAGRKLKALGEKAERIGKRMSLMVTLPILAAGGAAIKMAMDAEESRNLFEVSMGGMVDVAEKWSAQLSDSFGVNRYESQRLIGTFNVMLKSLGQNEQGAYDMAKGMTELGYDMASFFNLEPEEAFDKLRAAITGETEPLKRLGIVVNETTIKQWALNNGMIKQGEVLDESQKIVARYNVIMERTALAQGDLGRTLDSPTNKLRILKSRVAETAVEFGMKMMPAFEKMLKLVEKGVKWFGDLSDSSKVLTIKIGVVAASIGPLLIGFAKIIKYGPQIAKAVNMMTGPFGLVTIAILAAGAAIDYFIKKSIEKSDEQIDAMIEAGVAHKEYWDLRKKLIDEEVLTVEEFKELYDKHGRNYQRVMKAIATLPEYEEIKNAWKGVEESIGESVDEIKTKIELLPEPLAMVITNLKDFSDEIELRLIPSVDSLLEDIEVIPDTYEEMSEGSEEFMNNLIDTTANLGKQTAVTQKLMNKGAKLWKKEQLKELSGFEAGIVSMMNVYEQGMEGILQAAKRWAIAEAVKWIMARPLLFPIKLALAAGAIAGISGLYSQIAKAEEGMVLTKPTVIEAGHGRGEAIIPLEKLPAMVKEITRETTIRETGAGIIHLSVYLGTDLIAEEIVEIIQDKAEKGEIEIPVKVML